MGITNDNSKHKDRSNSGLFKNLKFLIKNLNVLKGITRMQTMRTMLVRANIELGKLKIDDPLYIRRVDEFNQAMILSSKAKWHMSQAMESRSRHEWKQTFRYIDACQNMAKEIREKLDKGNPAKIDYIAANISNNGSGILFADGVPLIPAVNPIVILQGSDFDMGYQYAQQVIQIFGSWIMERKAGRSFDEEECNVLLNWEAQLEEHTPEIIPFCQGWAVGATEAGIAMSYKDVLEIWVGRLPPAANYLAIGESVPQLNPPLCSGVAAWGRATKDGKLVVGATGDHDPTFSVTIVAFPETGNHFIYTPFSAVGDVPIIGPVHMMGHPGMNDKGLVYVEHGGEPRMIEPQEHWGYGLRRGAGVMHVLRFASTAREALEMELSFPIGDVGRAVGSVGGFFADNNYGYILESRMDPVIIRESGEMGETDFLYANNSAQHPEAEKAGWMQRKPDNWTWHPQGGWRPKEFSVQDIFGALRGSGERDKVLSRFNLFYSNSSLRNQDMYEKINQGVGRIDFEYIKKLYHQGGSLPEGTWEDIEEAFKDNGKWGHVSAAHAGNALVAVLKPDHGYDGIYSLCVGTAARGLTPNTPTPGGGPIYDETNTFWDIKLLESPESVCQHAGQIAERNIRQADEEINHLSSDSLAYQYLANWLDQAQSALVDGQNILKSIPSTASNEAIYAWAKATRAYTQAQVRARQVTKSLNDIKSESVSRPLD